MGFGWVLVGVSALAAAHAALGCSVASCADFDEYCDVDAAVCLACVHCDDINDLDERASCVLACDFSGYCATNDDCRDGTFCQDTSLSVMPVCTRCGDCSTIDFSPFGKNNCQSACPDDSGCDGGCVAVIVIFVLLFVCCCCCCCFACAYCASRGKSNDSLGYDDNEGVAMNEVGTSRAEPPAVMASIVAHDKPDPLASSESPAAPFAAATAPSSSSFLAAASAPPRQEQGGRWVDELRAESSEFAREDRVKREAAANAPVSIEDAQQIVAMFTFGSSQRGAVVALYPALANQSDIHRLLETIPSDFDRDILKSELRL